MSEATYHRILDAARAMQYDPSLHQAARQLVTRRTGKAVLNQVIALMFPRHFHSSQYFQRIFQGILDRLMVEDYGLLSYHPDFHHRPLPLAIRRGDVDGLIVYESIAYFQDVLDALRTERNFAARPVVFLMQQVPECSSVRVDDLAGGCAAAGHLLDLGHRHLICFAVEHYAHRQRLEGFRQACVARQLDPAQCLHVVPLQSRAEVSYDAAVALLRENPEITGILAPFDDAAIRLHALLSRQGLRVPEDISLVGFDDVDPLPDRYGRNLLTTIRVPLEEVGTQAADCMLRQIAGVVTEPETIILPVELVVRKSTAPPAISSS